MQIIKRKKEKKFLAQRHKGRREEEESWEVRECVSCKKEFLPRKA